MAQEATPDNLACREMKNHLARIVETPLFLRSPKRPTPLRENMHGAIIENLSPPLSLYACSSLVLFDSSHLLTEPLPHAFVSAT